MIGPEEFIQAFCKQRIEAEVGWHSQCCPNLLVGLCIL